MGRWPEPLLKIGGLSMLAIASDQSLVVAAYHPNGRSTWRWAVYIGRHPNLGRDKIRAGQWHDYYWLPFGFRLIVSQQDYSHLIQPQ